VCEEALCPNLGECWKRGTATFLLMGNICTRACRFCNIRTGRPLPLDEEEPERVAESIRQMGLRHAVLTSVDRDDLPDGGASHFAATIRAIRRVHPSCTLEVLIPDFRGDAEALRTVVEARPEILNHNVETVSRLSRLARPQASYDRSLTLLSRAKAMDAQVLTKTGVMVGLGEQWDELLRLMDDLRGFAVDILTIGQYLQPTKGHLPIERYYTPEEFEDLAMEGRQRGFLAVVSGPLVRSSYHAERQAEVIVLRRGENTTTSLEDAEPVAGLR
jgi:lipoic acid synthetase